MKSDRTGAVLDPPLTNLGRVFESFCASVCSSITRVHYRTYLPELWRMKRSHTWKGFGTVPGTVSTQGWASCVFEVREVGRRAFFTTLPEVWTHGGSSLWPALPRPTVSRLFSHVSKRAHSPALLISIRGIMRTQEPSAFSIFNSKLGLEENGCPSNKSTHIIVNDPGLHCPPRVPACRRSDSG